MASTFNDTGFDFGTGYVADATMVNHRGANSQVFALETSITSIFRLNGDYDQQAYMHLSQSWAFFG
jgi:hypothetical protein